MLIRYLRKCIQTSQIPCRCISLYTLILLGMYWYSEAGSLRSCDDVRYLVITDCELIVYLAPCFGFSNVSWFGPLLETNSMFTVLFIGPTGRPAISKEMMCNTRLRFAFRKESKCSLYRATNFWYSLMMALYTWAETCCSKTSQHITVVVVDGYHSYFYVSPLWRDVPVKNIKNRC